jgi:hypothetical protein
MRRLILAAALALSAIGPAVGQGLEVPADGYVVSNDVTLLPAKVRQKRAALLAIAGSGELASLGPLLDSDGTVVSFGDPEDKIAYLRDNSRDPDGVQILALLAELLEAPYAAMKGGDGDAIYTWPYLAAFTDLTHLTPAQRVDAYKLVTPDELDEMVKLDAWYDWRVVINANGQLAAFVAGD